MVHSLNPHFIYLAEYLNDWINATTTVHCLCLLIFIQLDTPCPCTAAEKKNSIRWWITWMTYLLCAIGSCCIVLQNICINFNSNGRCLFQYVASNKIKKWKWKTSVHFVAISTVIHCTLCLYSLLNKLYFCPSQTHFHSHQIKYGMSPD